jgi:aryl-alcohol dehydrogenase-like predicted oxidoreductase
MRAVCERYSVPLKAAAVQFPLGHEAVTAVVVGCRSKAQLEESLRMFEIDIPRALWEELKAEGLLSAEVPTP